MVPFEITSTDIDLVFIYKPFLPESTRYFININRGRNMNLDKKNTVNEIKCF